MRLSKPKASCISCGSENTRIRNVYHAVTVQGLKYRYHCNDCQAKWIAWRGEKPDPNTYRKKANRNQFTEEQIRLILAERSVSQQALGRRLGKSRTAIGKIRRGELHADVAPDLPRWKRTVPDRARSNKSCIDCHYCVNRVCKMAIPEFEEEGPTFAAECLWYGMRQSTEGV
jgi:transposase-like protein